ncbi:ATP-binding protein, partial [Acetobacter sp.]|uniref:ATP-binding protein n=1 Tax=Acetobacter sp. TaxID=440 RepID=UPI0039EA5393
MDPVHNPYVPGAGASPPELAGREALFTQAEIVLRRALIGKSARSFIATGLRGVGKTVVLARVEQIAQGARYLTCFVEAEEEKRLGATLAPHLRRMMLELDRIGAVTEQVKRGLRVLKSFAGGLRIHSHYGFSIGLDVEPERGTADTGDLTTDLPDMISALGAAAQSRGTGVALFIDEIQNLPEQDIAALIMAMHRVMREGLPVVLVGAGLPHLVPMIGQTKSYAERLFEFPVLGPLSPAECAEALQTPAAREGVDFTQAAVDEVVRITKGYPYFLQEWAYHAWNVAHGDRVLPGD